MGSTPAAIEADSYARNWIKDAMATAAAVVPAPIVANFDFSNSIGSEDMFTEATKRALQRLNRFGDSTNYAGAIG
jgi:PPE-repeat protein